MLRWQRGREINICKCLQMPRDAHTHTHTHTHPEDEAARLESSQCLLTFRVQLAETVPADCARKQLPFAGLRSRMRAYLTFQQVLGRIPAAYIGTFAAGLQCKRRGGAISIVPVDVEKLTGISKRFI